MSYEIETKVLDINTEQLKLKMKEIGAKLILDTKLIVDWFRTKGSKEGDDAWYLRVRSYSDGKNEVTWKGSSEGLGISRKHREINLFVSDKQAIVNLFEKLNLEIYAHQEKIRTSWKFNDLCFDLDQYPGMPAYLEIEGAGEEEIKKAIETLGLQNRKTSSEGERKVISEVYGLNWYQMKF